MLKELLLAALDPNYGARQAELNRLRKGQGIDPAAQRGWYRFIGPAGETSGFAHVCQCGIEIRCVSPLDYFKDYRCNCGETFALFKDAGVPRGCAPADFNKYLMRLPARRAGGPAQAQRKPFVDTWDDGGAGSVEWVGTPQPKY
jgi:hypothetical protein